MYFLGIDYGTKRVGIALAREGRIATPLTVFNVEGLSPEKIASQIADLVQEYRVTTVVVGESKDFNGLDNPIMKKIRTCVAALKQKLSSNVGVIFEPEFLTTQQAERSQGKHALIDASAAALILQSYLDRTASSQ